MNRISLAEFNVRTEGAYTLLPPIHDAREHWAGGQGLLLGVVVFDRYDKDWGFVVLGRNESNRFRAIDVQCSHPTIDEARNALRSAMREIAASGAAMFPLGVPN